VRNSNTGAFEVYDISNNNITAAANVGTVGLTWGIAGFGDFNGDGGTDMILRDGNTGAFEVYDISNNAITSAANLGTVGLSWDVAGFGDFNADGTTEIAPELTGHGLPLGKCEAYNRVYDQFYQSR